MVTHVISSSKTKILLLKCVSKLARRHWGTHCLGVTTLLEITQKLLVNNCRVKTYNDTLHGRVKCNFPRWNIQIKGNFLEKLMYKKGNWMVIRMSGKCEWNVLCVVEENCTQFFIAWNAICMCRSSGSSGQIRTHTHWFKAQEKAKKNWKRSKKKNSFPLLFLRNVNGPYEVGGGQDTWNLSGRIDSHHGGPSPSPPS